MQNKKQINLKLDEKIGEGVYSNLVVISHNQSEFIIDFGRLLPGLQDAKILSRIIKTPQHAKQFLNTLKNNIENYEKQYGEIVVKGLPEANKSIGFTNNKQDW